MNSEKTIRTVAGWVKKKLSSENSGHGWDHARAVWHNAKEIAEGEVNVNKLIVELAALLHDVNDWKQEILDSKKNTQIIENQLRKIGVDERVISQVMEITKKVSFLGPNFKEEEMSLEGQIAKDADRLEALGAIAWDRTRQFGKAKGIPDINEYLPNLNLTDMEYKNYKRKENSSINHVFDKLLLLKGRLVTKKAKEIGQKRHEELKEIVRNYLVGIRGKNLVSENRINEYLKMLDEPRFS